MFRNRTLKVLINLILLVVLFISQVAAAQPVSAPFTNCSAVSEIPLIECQALMALYNSTNGASWTDNTNWLTTDTPCNWFGVTCSGNSVIGLYMWDNNLAGNIPSELSNLNQLRSLVLYLNNLSGNIPPELGNLSQLTTLSLGYNHLSGNIPPELGYLSELVSLMLDQNLLLSGSIPSELGNLNQLSYLSLHSNSLSGNIPPELGNLTQLNTLYLYHNQLSGSIPSELGNLSQLRNLNLYDNQLSGSIPAELGNLIMLNELSLWDNQLSGGIPVELGNLYQLQELMLQSNQLSGTIPSELGNLSQLQDLYLSDNQLSGIIPVELGGLSQLRSLALSYNQLSGNIPPELGNLVGLNQLYLNYNQFSGEIPYSIINLTGLYILTLNCGPTTTNPDVISFMNTFAPGWVDNCLSTDVSSDLSTVMISPASLPADGVTSATITITLMDTNNNLVVGKTIMLLSDRGGNDIIVQPAAPTDTNGQATGTISSLFPGISQVYVVDVTDNIKLSQQPIIQFTENNLALRQRINTLNTLSTDSLTRVAIYAQSAGEHGDYFRDAIAEDVSNMALNAVGLFTGTVEGVKDINRLKGGVQLALPGLEDAGYGVVNGFLSKYPDSRDLFNFTVRKALQTGDYSSLTQPVLNAGFRYYAVKYINKKLESKVEDLTQDAVIRAWKDISSSSGGFTEAGNWLVGDINNMKSELNYLSNLPTPSMSAGQQAAYVEDLHKRSMVPVIIANTTRQQVFLLENVRAAHESNAWSGNFTLKFLADALATTAFDGPGHIMVNGLTDGFDLYLNARKFDSDMLAFSQVPGILKGSAESATYIFNNEATGLDRIHRLLLPQPVTGQITAVRNYSQGQSWGPFYFEDRSFSEIDIKNTSASETGTFEVITQYGYNTRIFRVPWAYMPLVKSETILLAPGESKTVRIYYKNGGTGGSPDKNDSISFDVLAANSTGVFYVGTKRVSWNPQVISGGVGSWAIENSSSLAQSDVVASSDAAIIENPISVYVTGNSIDQTYQAEIYVANPFDQTIDANITQDLPVGITVLTTDGTVMPDGSAISWQKNVASNEIVLVTFTFGYPSDPNASLSLPAATMSFVEPASGQSVNIQSNSPAFTGLSPLSIEGYAPIGLPNVESDMSITVTNLAGASNNGTIEITLADINGQIFADAKPFNIDGFGQQIVAFTLPGLSEGLYPVEIFTTINGVTTRVFGDTYQVLPPPTIASIMRANAASTGAPSVDFKVAFSESVVGVDAGDFALITSGVSGATISGVSGSGSTYTVIVNTGINNGTIRLDVPVNATITDLAGNPLANLPFTTGQTYTISKPVPKAPALRSPRTNMVTNDNTPTFWWMKAKDGQSYEFEVAADANFISNVENEFVNGTSQTSTSPFVDGNYFWHVRAYNASNQPGAWSSTRTITIDTTGPSVPMLSTPTNNTSSKRTPTFKWLSVPTAVLYEFQYDNDLNFTNPISYTATVRGTFRRPPAMPAGTYYWHVRAKDAAGNWGEWSLPFTINITSP